METGIFTHRADNELTLIILVNKILDDFEKYCNKQNLKFRPKGEIFTLHRDSKDKYEAYLEVPYSDLIRLKIEKT